MMDRIEVEEERKELTGKIINNLADTAADDVEGQFEDANNKDEEGHRIIILLVADLLKRGKRWTRHRER